MRHLEGFSKRLHGLRLEAHLVEVERQRALVQHAQHHLLAVLAGQERHTEIDFALIVPDTEPAVLRQPVLINAASGQNLEARHEIGLQRLRRRLRLLQGAVHTVANPDDLLERLHVDVAGAALEAIEKDEAGQFLDRLVFCAGFQPRNVLDIVVLLLEFFEVFVALALLADQRRIEVLRLAAAVVTVDGVIQFAGDRDHGLDLVACQHAQFIERHDVQRIRHGQGQHVTRHRDGQHLILPREGLGHFRQHLFRNRVMRHPDMRDAQLLAQRNNQVFFAYIAFLDEEFLQTLPRGPVQLDALIQLGVRHQPLLEQHVRQPFLGNAHTQKATPFPRFGAAWRALGGLLHTQVAQNLVCHFAGHLLSHEVGEGDDFPQ